MSLGDFDDLMNNLDNTPRKVDIEVKVLARDQEGLKLSIARFFRTADFVTGSVDDTYKKHQYIHHLSTQVLIREYELSDYLSAADHLNSRELDAILLEYEFDAENFAEYAEYECYTLDSIPNAKHIQPKDAVLPPKHELT